MSNTALCLSCYVLSAIWLIIRLFTCRALYGRGWQRILPLFCRYVVILAAGGFVLWLLGLSTLYPSSAHDAMCTIYRVAGRLFSLFMGVFLFVVLYKILLSIAGKRLDIRRTVIVLFWMVTLLSIAAGEVFAAITHGRSGLPFAREEGLMDALLDFGPLALTVLIFVIKAGFSLPMQKGLGWILVALGFGCAANIAQLLLAAYRGQSPMLDIADQISAILMISVWYWAVRTNPRVPEIPAAAT